MLLTSLVEPELDILNHSNKQGNIILGKEKVF